MTFLECRRPGTGRRWKTHEHRNMEELKRGSVFMCLYVSMWVCVLVNTGDEKEGRSCVAF